MAHLHSVYDTDTHFSIDSTTRKIQNTAPLTDCLIQHDHNSERFTFDLPRYIDGHDMSLCNKTEVHYINIGTDGAQNKGVYVVDDIAVSPDDDSVVICSWLISANATQLAGSLSFLIRFACLTGDVIDYAWHTDIYTGIEVKDGMNNGAAVVVQFPDVLEAWRQEVLYGTNGALTEIEAAHDGAMTDIAEAKATMLEEIELAAEIVQTTGESETAVMCQKAVTDELRYLEMNDVKRKPSYFLWGTNKYSPESSWVDIEGVNVYKLRGVKPFDVIEIFTTDEALELTGWRSQYMCISESESGVLTNIMPAVHARQKSTIIVTPYNCVNLYWVCLPTANFGYRFVLDHDSEFITRQNVYSYSVNEYLADMGCYFGGDASIRHDSTLTSATFYLNKGDTVSIKSINTVGMRYNLVARKKISEGGDTIANTLVTSEWVAPEDCIVNLIQSLVEDDNGEVKEFDVYVTPHKNDNSPDLSTKKWVAFGDSITQRNTWQPYLIDKYGLKYANLGIGSTCIINAGNSPMCSDERINAIIAENPDIVTILGGANDITFFEGGSNATAPYPTMGDKAQFELALEDKDKTTFYGAYSYIIEKLLTWKPTLRIIILGTTYGDLDGKKYNPTGQYTNKDFAKASEEVAYNYGLTFVDLYGNVGFNKFTMNASPNDAYSNDFIHPNEAGSLRIAEVVNKTFSTLFNY